MDGWSAVLGAVIFAAGMLTGGIIVERLGRRMLDSWRREVRLHRGIAEEAQRLAAERLVAYAQSEEA